MRKAKRGDIVKNVPGGGKKEGWMIMKEKPDGVLLAKLFFSLHLLLERGFLDFCK